MTDSAESITVDTVVLYNELAYHDVVPIQWVSPAPSLSRFEMANREESNLLLLQACVVIAEHPLRDYAEDTGPLAGELARLDLKLNLVLQLLGRLALKERMPPAVTVRFNATGASWTALGALPDAQQAGLLRIHLHGSLPQPLELPGTVSAVSGSQVQLRFDDLPERVAELIQRLAFLCHRRDIADARKSRGP